MNSLLTITVSILGLAGLVGAASAILISSRTKTIMQLQGIEITTLKERVDTETKMRLDCQKRLTVLEEQGPSLVALTRTIVENHKEVVKLLSKKVK